MEYIFTYFKEEATKVQRSLIEQNRASIYQH
jgi:hypothetical protein